MSMLPPSQPRAARELVIQAARQQWQRSFPGQPLPATFFFGCRGYYQNSMGEPGKNDRNIYDDAIAVVGPDAFAMFNANVDPSAWRRNVATLLPGCHPYHPGNHGMSRPGGGYPAFRPATPGEELPVKRDGDPSIPSKDPGVAINIHKGGYGTTSSLGCQTLHPDQWKAFYNLAILEFKKAELSRVFYILVDGPIN